MAVICGVALVVVLPVDPEGAGVPDVVETVEDAVLPPPPQAATNAAPDTAARNRSNSTWICRCMELVLCLSTPTFPATWIAAVCNQSHSLHVVCGRYREVHDGDNCRCGIRRTRGNHVKSARSARGGVKPCVGDRSSDCTFLHGPVHGRVSRAGDEDGEGLGPRREKTHRCRSKRNRNRNRAGIPVPPALPPPQSESTRNSANRARALISWWS
jgi:hypothetical protein